MLTADELATVKEITRESASIVATRASGLTPELEELIRRDIEAWEAVVNKTLEIGGGREGVTISPKAVRAEIRERVRANLDLPSVIDDGSFQLFDLSLGNVWL